jgi:methionyl-tRNA synthetase
MGFRFYVTTTLPYVNAEPHLGFALEIVQADVLARYHRAKGETVFFNTGTDEHGLKIYRKALEAKQDPQAYVDSYAARFETLKDALNLSYTNFIRTTDLSHVRAAQAFWRRCLAQGDIYKKNYRVKYCVGCELEKTESELTDGRCAVHPNQELEIIEEENYFFRFSKYQEALRELYRTQENFVMPRGRLTEIRSFAERGFEDFSISRLKAKMPWGVPVPDDADHVMYVWFDALVNYISTLGWPDEAEDFEQFWVNGKTLQVAGKDNLRQQSAMWQAMLFSAGLKPTDQIFIHGFVTHDGVKMSKSIGNVVDPVALVGEYGTDAVRYYLLRGMHPSEDSDYTREKFVTLYNADLANGLGNLVQRVTTLAEKASLTDISLAKAVFEPKVQEVKKRVGEALKAFEFNRALEAIWELVASGDSYVNGTKVWSLAGKEQEVVLADLSSLILNIANLLELFLPATAVQILSRFGLTLTELRSPGASQLKIRKGEPLFKRIS